MNETQVTMIGNAVEDPVMRFSRNGDPYVTLRLASTVRRRDQSGQYVDAGTNFVTVLAFRQLATNVTHSVRKGQPLVVNGRLRVNQWRSGERSGTSVEIDATSIGHDLSRGVASFNRVRNGGSQGSFPASVPGAVPQPQSDEGSQGDAIDYAPIYQEEPPFEDEYAPVEEETEYVSAEQPAAGA